MGNHSNAFLWVVVCLSIVKVSQLECAEDEDREVHVVYMGSLPEGQYSSSSHHYSLLQQVVSSNSSIENLLVRSYKRSFNGFAAKLTAEEREKVADMEEVVSVFPSKTLQLHTTRSWDFMGFDVEVSKNPGSKSDVIVGVIDTGVWPESTSFNDEGFGPIPKNWKGDCNSVKNFTCNKKLIGARDYTLSLSARDDNGHGTHTASTAAGVPVEGTSFYGLAQGTARGGAPTARIAVYKVCEKDGCAEHSILAAFDDSIADGVDIITISIGSDSTERLNKDAVSIGGFHSMEKGILTLQSAGNNGPSKYTVTSLAPWLLTVAASTTDRLILDKVVLGNGKILVGGSANSFTPYKTKVPLVYGPDAGRTCASKGQGSCSGGCLNESFVKGKIVVCGNFDGYEEAENAGASGTILPNPGPEICGIGVLPLPAAALYPKDINIVQSYINSTRKPVATIFKSEVTKNPAAPLVILFSSRGPNRVVPDIMKPDISAPGVDILAAYVPKIPPSPPPSPSTSPSRHVRDKRRVNYSILSGTSMACPHVAGVAAHVKAYHPQWSPSAIKSAIMTTAWSMKTSRKPDDETAYGSGHVNPTKAVYPGLVYDASLGDYVKLLCSMGFITKTDRTLSKDNSPCPTEPGKTSLKDFNYPSMTVRIAANKPFNVVFLRTVTNVGLSNSTYTAKIASNPNLNIKLVPEVLSFVSLNEKKSFAVTLDGRGWSAGRLESASLVWSDGSRKVSSPIVVYTT